MQLVIPYASFGSLGLFQVFWFAYGVHGRPASPHRSLKLVENMDDLEHLNPTYKHEESKGIHAISMCFSEQCPKNPCCSVSSL